MNTVTIEQIKEALLKLPKNPEYKQQKIVDVRIDSVYPDTLEFSIETSFATWVFELCIEEDGEYCIGGNIISTMYDEIDSLLQETYNQNTLGDFSVELPAETDLSTIIDEMFNQMDQDEWKTIFKLLWKTYCSLERQREDIEECSYNAGELLREMTIYYGRKY